MWQSVWATVRIRVVWQPVRATAPRRLVPRYVQRIQTHTPSACTYLAAHVWTKKTVCEGYQTKMCGVKVLRMGLGTKDVRWDSSYAKRDPNVCCDRAAWPEDLLWLTAYVKRVSRRTGTRRIENTLRHILWRLVKWKACSGQKRRGILHACLLNNACLPVL